MPTKIMEDVDTTVDTPIIAAKEDAVHNEEEIGTVAESVRAEMVWHTTVGLAEFALFREKTAGPRQKATRRTWCGATRC